MVNATGGFAYIDMSVYGVFTPSTAKEVDLTIGDTIGKIKQLSKPVIIVGLQIDVDGDVTSVPATVVTFLLQEEIGYATSISNGDIYFGVIINADESTITISM